MRAGCALLLIDVIHPFEFEGGERLLRRAARIVEPTRRLAAEARRAERPVIYVNDNFGRWRSSFEELVERCEEGRGAEMVRALDPKPSDLFVLKPHRSGFYCTPLELLLADLGCEELVVAGLTTDMCVLSTVSDARMRDMQVTVVEDACEALDDERHETALSLMRLSHDARVVKAEALSATS
ncbi:MAG: cysteine hydrolase [Sandaracinaceae bacterium]|nr:MAG: cysteine hydrolase [Sandaracinaceae bacterium]